MFFRNPHMRGLLFGRFHKIPSVAMPALRPPRLAESTQKQSPLICAFILRSYLCNQNMYRTQITSLGNVLISLIFTFTGT